MRHRLALVAQTLWAVPGFPATQHRTGPWNITAGTVADLNAPDAVLVDDLYWKKLGIIHVGEVFELNSRIALPSI
jgi:hypothetical protein